jgi:hypothetical protein
VPKFEDLVAQAREAGVDADWLADLEAAYDASPLRKELKDAKEQLQGAIDRANRLEQSALTGTFKELGIKAKPTAFALPADLDKTDVEQVRTWAVDQGLIDPPPPPAPDADVAAMDRIAMAGTGSVGAPDADVAAINASSEEEFWQVAEASGLTR